MSRAPHLRDSLVTTGHLASLRHGLRVHCACGHHGKVPSGLIAQAPDTQIFDYKCRLRCSRCGRAGSADEVEVRIYLEVAPFTPSVRAREELRHNWHTGKRRHFSKAASRLRCCNAAGIRPLRT